MKNQSKPNQELLTELQELKQRYHSLKRSYEKIHIEIKLDEDMILKLLKAINTTTDAIFLTDTEGIITYVNSGFTALFGYTVDEVVGKVTPRIIKSGILEKEVYESFWKILVNKAEVKGEILNKRKNGELVWVESTSSPILDEQNAIIGFIGIQRDITERMRVNEELKTAEESDRLKSAFLANMSHEIRTPMNGILGFAELLNEPNLTGEERQKYISIIEESGIRMLNIITDIVSISKIESGQMEVSLLETNINEQIKYIYTFFKPEVERKGLQLLVKNTLPSKESIIKTDREKLYAILTNLVSNAIKFTLTGSIELGYKKKGKHIEFFVKDTGAGIHQEQKEIIFDRFRQGANLTNQYNEGVGLGLSISKAYVEMLGGKIWIESKLGKGSIFYFTIPYNAETQAKSVIEDVSLEIGADNQINPEVSGLKILIAEDDEASEMFISMAVKMYGKEFLKAETGVEAVEACRKNPDIDLVLMDIKMPEMNGYEATRQIRKFNKDVVIIAQTAYAQTGDREKAIEAGCNDYITKPIDVSLLKILIQKHFKK